MAHELTFKDGTAQMFSVRETPWHKEGHVLLGAPSYEEALALAGLRYTVEKRPTYRMVPAAPGDFLGSATIVSGPDGAPMRMEKNEWAFVTTRTDTGQELGAVGCAYTPLQNVDAFRVLEPLLDGGVAQLETGGSLREGEDAWLMVRFDLNRFGPIAQEVLGGEVVPYGLIANNHSGRRGVLLSLTPIRVVCANTLGAAERDAQGAGARAITVKHTSSVEERMVSAATELFAGIVQRYELVATQYERLRNRILSDKEFDKLLHEIAPDPRHLKTFNPEAKLAESVVHRAERKRAELRRLWTQGRGHKGDRSAWEAYNGVVEALDHNDELWPTRGGVYRTASLLDGRLRQLKDATLNTLLALAV